MTVAARQNLFAAALALLLGIAWTVGDWTNLAQLNLPDTDDVMRMQQVRDWIAGQALLDTSQHRLAHGLPMHWSRIADLAPAAIILLLRPLTGHHGSEVIAVVAWPILQFVALLLLTTSIARAIAPKSVGTVTVLAALAYPASSLFLPGRIDHHAVQLLLVLVQVRAVLAVPTATSGAVAGIAVAAGAAIGLETLPFSAVTAGIIVLGWLRRGVDPRTSGFGLGLAGALVALLPLAAHGGACDTIAPLAPVVIAGGLALSALGRIAQYRWQWLAVAATALAALGWPVAQPCLAGPYADVDPVVRSLWLAQVAEAQPLFTAPLAGAIAYGGLLAAGLIATLHLARSRGGTWWTLLAWQATSAAIALSQIRGAYVGAALAVVPIAALLAEARAAARVPAVLALWIAGTGLSWSLIAGIAAPKAAVAAPACTRAGVLARLNALPTGRVMAGIDLGSYILAGTRHSVVGAPYHRNNAGNRDLYRFLLGDPARAHHIADDWAVDYVVVCPGDMGTIVPLRGSIAGGTRPEWLRRLTPPGTLPAIFTPHRRLSARLPAR